MVASVDHAVKFFDDLARFVVDAIGVAKSRSVWGALALIPEIEAVILDGKDALPELNHLGSPEAMLIGEAAYECVKKIVAAA